MHTIQPDQPMRDPGYYQMAYSSVLKKEMTSDELDALVADAQAANVRNDLTGLLMIDKCLVVQWVEGRRSTVRTLWDKIQKDPRHHCIVQLLHRDFQEHRTYPDWAMQMTSRADLLAILHSAREAAVAPFGLPNPWAPAIASLCALIDPDYVEADAAPVQIITDVPDDSPAA